jgi:hypothetical protein
MSTGLFLVRRTEHLQRAADLLVAADDRVELALGGVLRDVAVYLPRDSYCDSGSSPVTFWPPRTCVDRGAEQLVAVSPSVPSGLRRLPESRTRCRAGTALRRDVAVPEPLRLTLGDVDARSGTPATSGLAAARDLAVRVDDLGGVACSVELGLDADGVRDPPARPRPAGAGPRAGAPAGSRGCRAVPASCWASESASRALDGELLELHGGAPASDGGRRVSRVGAGSRKRGRAYASDRGVDRMAPR